VESGRGFLKSAALLIPAGLIVGFCLLVPLGYLLVLSFNPPITGDVDLNTHFTVANYQLVFLRWFYSRILLRTIWVSALTTLLSAIFGTVLALRLWRAPPRTRRFLVLLVLSPLLVSIVTRTFGWMVLLGDSGVLNAVMMWCGIISEPAHMMFTQGAVIVALVHVFLPLMVLSVLASLDRVDPSLPQAAQTLGAGAITAFRRIILPLLTPGLAAGVTIVFSLSMSSYVTPALMGGSNAGMLTTLIYQQFVVTYNWHLGAALVAVLLATSLILVGLLLYGAGRRTRRWRHA
jgi:putative spermidine/putrescine transport system permease protein